MFLHVLLESLLPLGDKLGEIGFLLGSKHLKCLGRQTSMGYAHLRPNLCFLLCDGLCLGFVKVSAGDELLHCLVALVFLLQQRLHG